MCNPVDTSPFSTLDRANGFVLGGGTPGSRLGPAVSRPCVALKKRLFGGSAHTESGLERESDFGAERLESEPQFGPLVELAEVGFLAV